MMDVTKAELIAALSHMRGIADRLYGCYCNDVQTDRATKMEALNTMAAECGKVLWRIPLAEIEVAVARYPIEDQPND